MTETRRPWLPRTKLTVSILLLALFVYLLTSFSVAIPPFILALILAYVLTPPVNKLDGHLPIPRGVKLWFLFLGMVIRPDAISFLSHPASTVSSSATVCISAVMMPFLASCNCVLIFIN